MAKIQCDNFTEIFLPPALSYEPEFMGKERLFRCYSICRNGSQKTKILGVKVLNGKIPVRQYFNGFFGFSTLGKDQSEWNNMNFLVVAVSGHNTDRKKWPKIQISEF